MASICGKLASSLSASLSSSSLCGSRGRSQRSNWQPRRCFFNLPSASRSIISVDNRLLTALSATSALHRPLEIQFNEVIESLINGNDLSEEEAEACLNFLLNEANEALISAFLVLLRAKGKTFEEIVGLARAMKECAVKVDGIDDAVDIVGTSGDGASIDKSIIRSKVKVIRVEAAQNTPVADITSILRYQRMGKIYVVFVGRQPGIYNTWIEAASQVNGYKGAIHQSFKNREEAEIFFQAYLDKKATLISFT